MPTVEETITQLKEMGFSEEKAKKALMMTGWKGVEPAMEWILAHPDDDGTLDEEEQEEMNLSEEEAKKPKKELTDEEKAEQMKRLEELRVKKAAERVEREKQDAIEKEKRRVQEGKAITGLKAQLEEQQMKKIAEERRREKIETQKAKERVKAQIAADRAAKKEQEARERGEAVPASVHPVASPPPSQSTAAPSSAPKDYTETRLQIRQTDGKPIVQTFKAKESLSAVRLYVQLNRKDLPGEKVNLMTTFPRKVFSEDDYDKPLDALGLVPSAALVICK